MIQSILVLALFAIGLAKIVRAMPGVPALQRRLDRSWTGGKPLNCWTCLCFWCSLAGALLLGSGNAVECVVETVAAAGLGAVVLNKLEPIEPAMPLPKVEVEDADD